MKKQLTTILLVVTALLCLVNMASCDGKLTVKFSANGGVFSDNSTEKTTTVDKNATLDEVEQPTKQDYYFEGWSTSSTENNFWNFAEDKVEKDLTLYAVWSSTPVSEDNKISYAVNVKTAGGMPMAGVTVYANYLLDGDYTVEDFAETDAEGTAYLRVDKFNEYTVQLEDIPDGYNVEESYELNADLNIVLESQLLPSDYSPGEPLQLGDVMYDFTVKISDKDEYFTLSEALKNNDAVIINFWFSTCTPCMQEFPVMENVLYTMGKVENEGETPTELYKDKIGFIGLSQQDDAYSINSFKNGVSGLNELDLAYDGLGITTDFNITNFPTTVVIDRYGVIALIEVGALVADRPWQIMFDHFIGDDYKQQLVADIDDITPPQKPTYEPLTSEEIADVFENADFDLDLEYTHIDKDSTDESNELSWPFIIDKFNEEDVIRPSNSGIGNSYSMLITEIPLKAGEAIAFDYFAKTELGADRLVVLVDGHDIYAISGISEAWKTCYAYVADEDGTYEIAFAYLKDGTTDVEGDTVYMKNLRKVAVENIDEATYIYREAATKQDPDYSYIYHEFVNVVLGDDGYYHVGSKDGALLLADIMGYTLFSNSKTVYDIYNNETLPYADELLKYFSYASNSAVSGVVPVTKDLREMLEKIAVGFGSLDPDEEGYENEWLKLCYYYAAYPESAPQKEDPIKGLSTFSAYETILGGPEYNGSNVEEAFPNSVYYDRVIMPRGLLFAFEPTVSGTYVVTSYTEKPEAAEPDSGDGSEEDTAQAMVYEVSGWIFREKDVENKSEWLVSDNVARNIVDVSGCQMVAYLEAGQTYYIDIAFYDVYTTGEIRFRVEKFGDAAEGYYRFSLASPGYFTYNESTSGAVNKIIAGGVNAKLEADGYYHEAREDGRLGSVLYADFTQFTNIFGNKAIYSANPDISDLIKSDAFDFSRTEEDQYILNFIEKHYKNGAISKEKAVELAKAEMREMWEDSYEGYNALLKIDEVCEIFIAGTGKYHGDGENLTEAIRAYIPKIIGVGSTVYRVNKDGTAMEEYVITDANDPMIGCVAVDENLAKILQQLMDKYTFDGVDNSWTKLSYYWQYFCAATPI